MLFEEREAPIAFELDDGPATYDPPAGSDIYSACKLLAAKALIEQRECSMVFNDTTTRAEPGDAPQLVFERWKMQRTPDWRCH